MKTPEVLGVTRTTTSDIMKPVTSHDVVSTGSWKTLNKIILKSTLFHMSSLICE